MGKSKKSTKRGRKKQRPEKRVRATMRAGEAERAAVFSNVAFVSYIADGDTFYIEFGVMPNPSRVDAKVIQETGYVEAKIAASIMCPASLIPRLVKVLQDKYEDFKTESK